MISITMKFIDYHREYRSLMSFPITIEQLFETSYNEWKITFNKDDGNPISQQIVINDNNYSEEFDNFFENKILGSYYNINFCHFGYALGTLIYGIKEEYINFEKFENNIYKLVNAVNEYNKIYMSIVYSY